MNAIRKLASDESDIKEMIELQISKWQKKLTKKLGIEVTEKKILDSIDEKMKSGNRKVRYPKQGSIFSRRSG